MRATGENKDQISLIIAPTAKDGQEPALSQPVKLSGTVQELDEKFSSELKRVIGARASLIEQVDATLAILDAATKAQASKASSSLKSKGKSNAAVIDGNADDLDDDDTATQNKGSPATDKASEPTSTPVAAGNLFADLT